LTGVPCWPPGSDRQFYTHFDTNVQHWVEQVSWNYAEINEWPLTQRISALDALVQISVLVQSVHGSQCVVAQWRDEGGQGWTSAPGRSTLGAPNWGRNVTFLLRNVKCQRML